MQDDLDRHYPSSEVAILAVNEFGQESGNALATQNTDLPLLQDVDANGDNQSDVWAAWDVTWRDVRVVDSDANLQHVVNLTPTTTSNNSLEVPANYEHLLSEIVEVATADRVAGSPWQNPIEPYDVSNDGFVVPNDVLRIINRINADGAGQLGSPTGELNNYYDVTGDNFVTSLDALRIIRHLNRYSNLPASEPAANAADAFFAMAAADQDDDDESP